MSGDKFIQAPDGGLVDEGEGWILMEKLPFLHGCCECGLVHRVEASLGKITVFDEWSNMETGEGGRSAEGELVPFPEGHLLALRFSRANAETHDRRIAKLSPAAASLTLELVAGVTVEEVNLTRFGEVPIQELDRDALLRIITLLAAGKRKEEPSRIILPGRMS